MKVYKDMKQTILITGGAGYIGSHTAYLMAQQGYEVIILDTLLHKQPFNHSWATLIQKDFADQQTLDEIFSTHSIVAVMHFAAFIEVGRSVRDPLAFYENNMSKTITLLQSMIKHNIKKFIFSSSCAVYGMPQTDRLNESHGKFPISPYGNSKLMVEMALHDARIAHDLQYVALRYFNAAGLLPGSGLGEYHDPETHIIPLLIRASQENKPFYIYGNDYATPDGTCVRDYLHVLDIARAHAQALDYLAAGNKSECFNLGSGMGYSVAQLINIVERAVGNKIDVIVHPRRAGDPAKLVADPKFAQEKLGWKAQYSDMENIIRSCVAESVALANERMIKSINI